MSGPSREMTLDEVANQYGDHHAAAKELLALRASLTQERSKRERMDEALEKFGCHLEFCKVSPSAPCSCGLNEARGIDHLHGRSPQSDPAAADKEKS